MFAKSQLKDAKSELKAAERHIKPGTYAVDSNGKVIMTYVDGNGNDVANEKAVIEGIAKKTTCRILQTTARSLLRTLSTWNTVITRPFPLVRMQRERRSSRLT